MSSVDEIMHSLRRNPFFLPSGFLPQEVINISEYTSDNKIRLGKIKFRRQQERRILELRKIAEQQTSGLRKLLKIDEQPKVDQIQRGLDLAKKWGWGGFNRTYHPNLTKVF